MAWTYNLCEVCGQAATCECSGLDVPALNFCEQHGKEHESECPDVKRGVAWISVWGRGTTDKMPTFESMMDEIIKQREAEGWTPPDYPCWWYNEAGGCIEVILSAESYYAKWNKTGVDTFHSDKDDSLVGFVVHGVKKAVLEPEAKRVQGLVGAALEVVKWTDKAIESGYSDDLFKSAMDELKEALAEYRRGKE